MSEPFQPPFYLRSAFIQTMLASSSIRKWGRNPMAEAVREVTLHLDDGVRLQGFYSPQRGRSAKGLVVLLTGWEGSATSAYILGTGKFLYRQGYAVFRLHFRDHGGSHHLNPDLFYATLLDEVFEGIQQASAYEKNRPFFLVGFSLGGNFALRIARKCSEFPLNNLSHVFSISPVLDPEKSTDAIDRYSYIRRYFLKKWRRSLLKKQQCFPERYDFTDVLSLDSLRAMTDVLIDRFSDYDTASSYFNAYSLLNDALIHIAVPTTIIAAKDDPIIPATDFYDLNLNSQTDLIIHTHGGHNGFIETLTGRAWYEKKIVDTFRMD